MGLMLPQAKECRGGRRPASLGSRNGTPKTWSFCRHLFLTTLEAGKFKIKVPADLA